MYDCILVATDGSDLSRKAVNAAIQLSAKLGAELFILHVVPRYPISYFEGAVPMQAEEVMRVERQWSERGRALVNEEAARAEKAGVTARATIMHSDNVAETILTSAHKHGCGLIVMASHGRHGLQRVLLGSETQHVLTRGDLPVLVLR